MRERRETERMVGRTRMREEESQRNREGERGWKRETDTELVRK